MKNRYQHVIIAIVCGLILSSAVALSTWSSHYYLQSLQTQVVHDAEAYGRQVLALAEYTLSTRTGKERQEAVLQLCRPSIMANSSYVCAFRSDGTMVAPPHIQLRLSRYLAFRTTDAGNLAERVARGDVVGVLTTRHARTGELALTKKVTDDEDLWISVHFPQSRMRSKALVLMRPGLALGLLLCLAISSLIYLVANRMLRDSEAEAARLRRQVDREHEQLRRMTEGRGDLVNLLCHDFANPLAAIAGQAEILKRLNMDKLTPELFDEAVDDIAASAARTQETIQLVRQLQEFEAGKVNIQPVPVDVEAELQTSLTTLAPRLEAKNIDVELSVEPGLQVMAEPLSFGQTVLNNLLTNAIKFSHPGQTIHVSAASDGEFAAGVRVSDHGLGMAEAQRADIFTPARASSRIGTAGEKGTGFGMPLVKRFVEAYGGSIRIASVPESESADEHGTTVELRLRKPSETA